MSHSEPLSQWMETVSTAFPNLSRPQAKVLAYWSYGMIVAKACGIVLVSAALALELGEKEASVLQRLREWCYAATDKKGRKRRELDVSTCFAPRLALGAELVASRRGAPGAGVRCHDVEETLYRALYQCGVSRLRYPGGLKTGRGGGKRLVAAALVRPALAPGRSGARVLDGAGAQ